MTQLEFSVLAKTLGRTQPFTVQTWSTFWQRKHSYMALQNRRSRDMVSFGESDGQTAISSAGKSVLAGWNIENSSGENPFGAGIHRLAEAPGGHVRGRPLMDRRALRHGPWAPPIAV
ncbi:hypothetical protein CEXT_246271 [Caerostris extrusa]|uniref:Uncharacterized protein n=1 Tax=Caerostris extrusa TaxID=172846 RepID=A0AAV4RAI3_CAEEX|nr:hypothetical protein CEXT_246271 [Caerostris extrusa]